MHVGTPKITSFYVLKIRLLGPDPERWLCLKQHPSAKRVGFDYTLLPARFTSLECGDGQNDALATSAYLAAATERLKIIGAFHTAYWHPAMIAKSASTIDVASGGRYALNILSG
jgi:dimethylsulfone monooxygenase